MEEAVGEGIGIGSEPETEVLSPGLRADPALAGEGAPEPAECPTKGFKERRGKFIEDMGKEIGIERDERAKG